MFQNQLQKYATKNINQTQICQTVIYSWHFGNDWIKSFFALLRQSKMKSRIQNFFNLHFDYLTLQFSEK